MLLPRNAYLFCNSAIDGEGVSFHSGFCFIIFIARSYLIVLLPAV